MKKIFFLLAVATMSYQNQNFTIQGTIDSPFCFEGRSVYLETRVGDSFLISRIAIVRNGAFTFTGVADDALRYITLSNLYRVPVLLEQGTINVRLGDAVSVSGTKINTEFNEFRIEYDRIRNERMTDTQRFREMNEAGAMTDEQREEFFEENEKLGEERRNLTIAFIRNNIENAAGRHVLITSIVSFPPEIQEEFVALADDNLRAEPAIARIITRMENARNVAVGNRFVDFTMNDPESNEVSLSDFAGRGNYTLVVFWATWCAPCVQRVPYLREIYAKYQSRGFEIVGVSFDANHSAWVNAIRDLNIIWTQMSDMRGVPRSPVWDLYALEMVPYSVLLDREGIIIARNLRGEALENKLAELMP